MIIIEKPSGCTINKFIEKYKKEHNIKKLCFCGRLDPMARGKVMILINDECKMISQYLNFDKTYQFEICFGFQTDTDDFLGIVQNKNNSYYPTNLNKIIEYINNISDYEFQQKFHKYSSKRVNGKTIREQTLDIIPSHNVKIYETKYIESKYRDFKLFINSIINDINTIDKTKNFRQNEIIKQWDNINRDYIFTIKFELKVSSGFYIRQFVRDLSYKFNFPMIVYDINRVNIIEKQYKNK
jgi:tRNA pseudouridine(55) synthase